MNWMTDLKLAIIEKNISNIGKLIKDIPDIDDMAKAQEALALINEAIVIVDNEKSKALQAMNKLKQTKAFLESH